ncbi:hypothetical protein [Trebonia sp.]
MRSKITSCPLPTTSQARLHVVAVIFTIGPGTRGNYVHIAIYPET